MVNEDFSIFARDPALTSLRDLTTAGLRAELSRCLSSALPDARPEGFRIISMRYTPLQKLIIGLNAGRHMTPVAIRIFPRASVQDRLAKARRTHPEHSFLLNNLNAVAWVFPGERKLRLDLVADRSRLSGLLARHRGYRLDKLEPVHVVPEHTYTARVEGARDDGRKVCEYLKVYYNDQGATTARLMQQVAEASQTSAIEIPANATYLARERLLIQPELARDGTCQLDDASVAAALAELHGLPVAAAQLGNDDLAASYASIVDLVAHTFPPLVNVVQRIGGEIQSALLGTQAGSTVLLHGDAHLGNLFPLVNGNVGIIDLDRMGSGPAEEDLASYYAFRLWLRLRSRQSTDVTLTQFAEFVRTYNRSTNQAVSVRRAYFVLAHKMVIERIRRGITRGKVSSGSELAVFARIAAKSLKAGRESRD